MKWAIIEMIKTVILLWLFNESPIGNVKERTLQHATYHN